MSTVSKKTAIRCINNLPWNFKTDSQIDYYPLAITSYPAICNEELCTVGYDHAMITWATPKRLADTTICFGDTPERLTKYTVNQNTQYHWVEIHGLKSSARYWYRVECKEAQGPLNSFTTLPKPEGRHLFSYAIFSDTHIASTNPAQDINEIYFGKLVEYSSSLLVQCIQDSKRRNIDLAVLTGDLTDSANKQQYLELRNQILPCFGDTPHLLCIGNHDKYTKDSGIGEQGFLDYVSNREKTCANYVFRDYQFILVDSCRENNNWGYIDQNQLQWTKNILQNEGKPSYLFLHHPCNGPDLWFGVKNHIELKKTIRPFSCVQGVFCGHIHRNKVTANRFMTGNLPYVEVPATVQFPCAYAVVQVFENGFVYNSYKVSRLDLSEMSRGRFILKNGGNAIFTWYGLGGIGDRCFSYSNGRLFRPARFELSVTLEHQRAVEFYQRVQSVDGASLTCSDNINNLKVVLGHHDLHLSAVQSYRDKFSRFNINATISKEGNYDVPQQTKLRVR
ncbi:metallophosphoesterase family protein [Pelotomaculum terephthalicicum JT]|uniref:purple acid phosphatase family protein n=1 Tax=Pelotomaculum TaxID=191373 RepID=UPI0009C42684|nr:MULTISPECIES: metallophosphoesterase family protein [Pelotomaculum]MCG9968497.1 metallophosphoesterase family protein [Pelotomaculum terephthalicicum JT]OPX85062.1 MAG: cyclic 3',5'-adenosine monophosphate phosphodiesterase [Pelotomaculum sp. PtaB.Bin117]